MGFALSFDAKNTVLRIAFEGCLTDADVLTGYLVLRDHVASHPACASIVDYTDITSFEVSTETVKKLVNSPRAMAKGFLRINVAPTDVVYGIARMFQMLSEEGRPELRVVRTMDEPRILLKAESLQFSPIGKTDAAATKAAS